jgi:hypothetical protein
MAESCMRPSNDFVDQSFARCVQQQCALIARRMVGGSGVSFPGARENATSVVTRAAQSIC